MSNKLLGFDTAAVQLPLRRKFDKGRGYTTVRNFKGTELQVLALETQYIAAGWSTEITAGQTWSLQATLAADDSSGGGTGAETPVDSWELFGNQTEKDILSSNIPGVLNMTNIDKHFMRDIMDGKLNAADFDYSTAGKTPGWGGDATQQGRADQIFRCIIAGTKSESINSPTLRHTKTASQDYEFASALAGVDYIYSKAALGSAENIPLWIFNNMPADPGINPFTRIDGIIVYKGWNKHYPQIQISAYGKSQIVVEWVYGEYATVLYPNYY